MTKRAGTERRSLTDLNRDEATPCDEVVIAQPIVSVIIPTRNRPQLLAEAIRSVQAQTVTSYEIILAVNGPTNPKTPQILEIGAGHRVVRVAEEGIAVALNAGIGIARGQWLAFLDDDDLWEPNRLEAALKTACETGADLIFCDVVIFNESGGVPAPPMRPPPNVPAREALTIRSYSGCSAAFARRSAVLDVGGFDNAMIGPDWDLWMRLAWRFKVAWSDAHLVWLRQHPRNSGLSWMSTSLATQRKALRTMPRDLWYVRARVVWEMIRVIVKVAESHVRRNWLSPVRPAKLRKTPTLRPPTDRAMPDVSNRWTP
jgi:glycosyltransferase involved in cell wall biosynthesis